ncbi:hypothetical protein Tco_1019990 [Tanacetum coccineum]|uniref:Uncharacterized protein n=1 Tax=Tanacetum coccineum TaxID=301880 RepID=A0ABQ5FYR9_9ASTR
MWGGDLLDEVTNFSVSYFKTSGKLAKLSIETTKKSYSIGDSRCHMVKERKTNVPKGTFDGIYGYNTGGREGKIRSIGFFKDKEEILYSKKRSQDLHDLAHVILYIISNGRHMLRDKDVAFSRRVLGQNDISNLNLTGTNVEALDLLEKIGIIQATQPRWNVKRK